jgi:hypothetical protein
MNNSADKFIAQFIRDELWNYTNQTEKRRYSCDEDEDPVHSVQLSETKLRQN